jgi:hypothetical protein
MIEVDRFSVGLLAAAAGIAATHTLLGPDHYLPFLALARARRWSRARTALVTLGCGIGHVASSLVLGAVGLMIGAGVGWVERLETHRGNLAGWALVWIGLAYMLWGVRVALRRRRGLEPHVHGGHVHIHAGGHHHHSHEHVERDGNTTFWTLFIVFVLGPCEPLIPLFVLPASRGQWGLAALTGVVFGAITIACMLGLVLLGHAGLSRLPFGRLERWAPAMAGAVILASGLAVTVLGL